SFPAVGNHAFYVLSIPSNLQSHGAAGGSKFHGIVQKVRQHLEKTPAIRDEWRYRFGYVGRDAQFLALDHELRPGQRFARNILNPSLGRFQVKLAGRDPRDVKEIFNQIVQGSYVTNDSFEGMILLIRRQRSAAERDSPAQYGHHRILQFMRKHRKELILA